MVWIISIALGVIIGAVFGTLVNGRAFGGANWIPTYIVLGALWGVDLAYNYIYDKNKYKDKGVLLTETKEHKKKLAKKKKKTNQ